MELFVLPVYTIITHNVRLDVLSDPCHYISTRQRLTFEPFECISDRLSGDIECLHLFLASCSFRRGIMLDNFNLAILTHECICAHIKQVGDDQRVVLSVAVWTDIPPNSCFLLVSPVS